MARLRIERREEGTLLLTEAARGRWGFAVAGVAVAIVLLNGVTTGDAGPLGAVVVVPLALIALLAGLAAARHRDWVLFDRRAREIVFRRGLMSIFRPVSVIPFGEVEAILVDAAEAAGPDLDVQLLRSGDFVWPLETSADSDHVSRLVTALQAVGDWPVLRDGVRQRPPYIFETR